ncbi:MAG: hypothetical protein EA418_12235 [Wenzhouxiangellaceae bacterium]|nr:MAG: hypothetical protein EA418_12235 [Wenzhouxiangellaceae bacterium]
MQDVDFAACDIDQDMIQACCWNIAFLDQHLDGQRAAGKNQIVADDFILIARPSVAAADQPAVAAGLGSGHRSHLQ